MKVVHSPHDHFFRSVMALLPVAKDLFQRYLPEIVETFADWESLNLCPGRYVDEKLSHLESDILYEVKVAGETAYIYLLCEHQSTVDYAMPFRIQEYILAIWRDYRKQTGKDRVPLVIPLVFYHGERPYDASLDIRELIDAPEELIETFLFKPYTLIDTHHLPDEELRQQLWSGTMAFVMKHIYARDMMLYLKEIWGNLRELMVSGSKQYVVSLLNYALAAGNIEIEELFLQKVREELSAKTGEELMSLLDKREQRGLQKGMQQGMQMGFLEGEHVFLLRLLKRKFDFIPQSYITRIETANEDTLLNWAERLINAKTIDEVFG